MCNNCGDSCLVKIGGVFSKVLENKLPRDDTFVEKLMTLCSFYTESADGCRQFVQETEILKLLDQTCTAELEPSSYSFFLRVFSVLCDQETFNPLCFSVTPFLNRIHEVAYKQDASVRNSWVAACRKLCQNADGFELFLKQEQFHKTLKDCCRDTSIFVSACAQNFAGYFIVKLSQNLKTNASNVEDDKSIVEGIIENFIVKPLTDKSSKYEVLSIVKAMCDNDVAIAWELIVDHIDTMISMENAKDFNTRKTWLEVLEAIHKNSLFSEQHIKALQAIPQQLVSEDHNNPACDLASWLLERVSECESLQTIVLSPLQQSLDGSRNVPVKELLQCLRHITALPCRDLSLSHMLILQRFVIVPKVLCACLDSCAILAKSATDQQITDMLSCVGKTLGDMEKPYIVISKALLCLHELLVCASPAVCATSACTGLATAVIRKTCDAKWEVRDSAMDFVGKLAQSVASASHLSAWMCGNGLIPALAQSCQDGESYVRATAITSLAEVLLVPTLRTELINDKQMATLMVTLINTAATDTEAFPRRAAVYFLCAALSCDLDLELVKTDDIYKTMRISADDFDWQVKIEAVAFWKKDIAQEFNLDAKKRDENTSKRRQNSGISEESLQRLFSHGCFEFLAKTVEDEDRSVQLQSCLLLKNLKEKLGTSVTKVQKMDPDSSSGDADSSNKKTGRYESVEAFCSWLVNELDLDSVEKTASSSTDRHVDNPDSFLDDVLGSMCEKEEVVGVDMEDEDNAGAVDCY